MRVNVPAFGLLAAWLYMACASANPVNRKAASNYYAAATEAELAHNYSLAEQNYDRALFNARLGGSPDAGTSAALYGLGRVKGYQCKFEEAATLLTESLALEETVPGPTSAVTSMRLFEVARLHGDRGLHAAAVPYFERGLSVVRSLGISDDDPAALAEALDDYATSAAAAGATKKAIAAQEESSRLRKLHPGRHANFKPVRYPRACPS